MLWILTICGGANGVGMLGCSYHNQSYDGGSLRLDGSTGNGLMTITDSAHGHDYADKAGESHSDDDAYAFSRLRAPPDKSGHHYGDDASASSHDLCYHI